MNKSLSQAKVAFVYDRVTKIGGAERVLQALHQLWPQAPLYTAVYQPDSAGWAKKFQIIPSFLQSIPLIKNHHEWFAWAMPAAFESFDFSEFDLVISITSAEAKGIITKPETLHLCYLLTPTRYLWSHSHFYQHSKQAMTRWAFLKRLTGIMLARMREWDYVAAQRPDQIIAISQTVARRCRKYYHRKVTAVIYPPTVGINHAPARIQAAFDSYYLLVSRLVPYKRVDLAVEAFRGLDENLIIVGEGSEYEKLRKTLPNNVRMVGKLTQGQLVSYYRGCKALIFPSMEDFGLVSVEAQLLGKPVIGFSQGGASETIVHKETGYLFKRQSPRSLKKAIIESKNIKFDRHRIIKHAQAFDQKTFNTTFTKYVEAQWLKHQKTIG